LGHFFLKLKLLHMRISILLATLLLITFNTAFSQNADWTPVSNSSLSPVVFEKHYKPGNFKTFQYNSLSLRTKLSLAPQEGTVSVMSSPVMITLPAANGMLERFAVVEYSIMQKGLADKFPSIKTYIGYNLDFPGSSARIDVGAAGLNAVIHYTDRKTTYINTVENNNYYAVVFDRDGMAVTAGNFICKTDSVSNKQVNRSNSADDGQRRDFRLAVTVNGEFSQACLNGTEPDDVARKAKVLSVLVTDLNRANSIYERDFGIRLNYVSGMDAVIYLDAASDPFATSQSGWNTATRQTLTNVIGNANFDIGHFIAKVAVGDENGNAGCIGCVCQNGTSNGTHKGSGFTAHTDVQGDPLVVDYWTHEMGHQFGANHTFTHSIEGTGANMEPGSGSTIMGYAGITGSTDVQPHSDDYFHAKSIDQVTANIKTGTSSTCPAVNATGNSTPVANAGEDYIIPKSTPFMLTGDAADANPADVLTYTWEQYNVYATGSNTFPATTLTTGPLFRSRPYSTSPVRVFPQLSSILSGTNGNTWEALPGVARTMNFRLTVRDNAGNGGSNDYDDMEVTVDASTGPFAVATPNTGVTWIAGEFQTITWNVAGTTGGNVNCADVAIELSTDGGNSFPIVLAASTPNDGSQEIIVPNNITAQARIRVRAVGNIFFDISNANFTIQAPAAGDFGFNTPPPVKACSGGALSATLNTASIGSYNVPISLSASGNPGGSTVVFSNNSIAPGNSITVSLQGTVAAGTYVVTITGVSGSITKTRDITFNVISTSGTPSLTTPVNNAVNQSSLPTLNWAGINGADSYTLDISTTSNFSSGVTSVPGITTSTYTLTTGLSSNTQYFWRVTAITICGNLQSSAFSFTTSAISCSTFVSVDVPQPISATGTPLVTSMIGIGNSGTITDVDVVGLQGTHTYISDLSVRLTSPANTSVTLFSSICTSQDNFNLNLDDGASSGTFPCPPTGGITRRPQQALSAFNGQSITGFWTLSIQDNFNQDGGSLDGWGLRFCVSGGVLPVNWLSFTAKRSGEKSIQLDWSTVAEINNKEFQVERSRDGISFEQIGVINAGNNTSGVQYYVFTDMKPFAGVNYYRLKQVDKDGKFQYSSIAKVTIDQDKNVFTVTPNPATSSSVITFLKDNKQLTVKLVDVSGKTVYTVSRNTIAAGETITLPVNQIAKGYYLVVVETGGARFTDKLVVQ